MELFPCLVIPLFLVLAGAVVIFTILKARQRREAMAQLAGEMGWEFYSDAPWDLPNRYGSFDLFQRGHSRRADNILAGEIDGRAGIAFDYRYTTGSGKDQTTHYRQVVVLELPILAARLRMRSEGLLDRVASWVGFDDIDFESDEFSRRYHVQCDDRRFAYDIFHARLIDYLLECGDVPDVEMNGPLIALYGRRGDVADVRRLIRIGEKVVQSIPDYVLKARGLEREGGGET